jgi:hypothetical protein
MAIVHCPLENSMFIPRSLSRSRIILGAVFAAGSISADAGRAANSDRAACSRTCLSDAMATLVDQMQAGNAVTKLLAPDAEVRENTRITPPDRTSWTGVKAIRSKL